MAGLNTLNCLLAQAMEVCLLENACLLEHSGCFAQRECIASKLGLCIVPAVATNSISMLISFHDFMSGES